MHSNKGEWPRRQASGGVKASVFDYGTAASLMSGHASRALLLGASQDQHRTVSNGTLPVASRSGGASRPRHHQLAAMQIESRGVMWPLKALTPYPTYSSLVSNTSRISDGLPTAPRAAADRYWTTTYRVWTGAIEI